ncbi:MAG: hypothetical protein MJ238_04530 [Bacilli bacterium]|nr:hypothetical protein [Bacilli bacterium]
MFFFHHHHHGFFHHCHHWHPFFFPGFGFIGFILRAVFGFFIAMMVLLFLFIALI